MNFKGVQQIIFGITLNGHNHYWKKKDEKIKNEFNSTFPGFKPYQNKMCRNNCKDFQMVQFTFDGQARQVSWHKPPLNVHQIKEKWWSNSIHILSSFHYYNNDMPPLLFDKFHLPFYKGLWFFCRISDKL